MNHYVDAQHLTGLAADVVANHDELAVAVQLIAERASRSPRFNWRCEADREDAAADAAVLAIERLGVLSTISNPFAWLSTLVMNSLRESIGRPQDVTLDGEAGDTTAALRGSSNGRKPGLMTSHEVAARLGLHVRLVQRLGRRGDLERVQARPARYCRRQVETIRRLLDRHINVNAAAERLNVTGRTVRRLRARRRVRSFAIGGERKINIHDLERLAA